MPKLTGIELLEKLHAAGMDVPVIMVSGTMPTEELKRRQWPTVEATLNKPYFIADLLKAVKHVLHTRGSSRAQLAPQLCFQDRSAGG
jgi:CheY-like chemotaxis protein